MLLNGLPVSTKSTVCFLFRMIFVQSGICFFINAGEEIKVASQLSPANLCPGLTDQDKQ